MRLFYILLISVLISIVSSAQMCDDIINATSYEECKNYKLPDGTQYCCYFYVDMEYKGDRSVQKRCAALTEEQFRIKDSKIEQTKIDLESRGYKVYDMKIECGQLSHYRNYSQYFLFALILLLLN